MCEECSPSQITKKRGGREGRKEEERMGGQGRGEEGARKTERREGRRRKGERQATPIKVLSSLSAPLVNWQKQYTMHYFSLDFTHIEKNEIPLKPES